MASLPGGYSASILNYCIRFHFRPSGHSTTDSENALIHAEFYLPHTLLSSLSISLIRWTTVSAKSLSFLACDA